MLANEKSFEAGSAQAPDVRSRFDPALADFQNTGGDLFGEPQRSLERYFKRLQVAIIDADHVRARGHGSPQLPLIVHLDESRHTVFSGQLAKLPKLFFLQN